VPYGLENARRHRLARPGDIALIVAVGSGVQVGCTTYRF
jgi:3-oxoacyl-[acyl-carrier-protein] synthase III